MKRRDGGMATPIERSYVWVLWAVGIDERAKGTHVAASANAKSSVRETQSETPTSSGMYPYRS